MIMTTVSHTHTHTKRIDFEWTKFSVCCFSLLCISVLFPEISNQRKPNRASNNYNCLRIEQTQKQQWKSKQWSDVEREQGRKREIMNKMSIEKCPFPSLPSTNVKNGKCSFINCLWIMRMDRSSSSSSPPSPTTNSLPNEWCSLCGFTSSRSRRHHHRQHQYLLNEKTWIMFFSFFQTHFYLALCNQIHTHTHKD